MSSLRSVSIEHFNLTAESSEANMHQALQALVSGFKGDAEKKAHFEKEMKGFERLFKSYLATRNQKIDWSLISPPKDDLILPLSTLPKASKAKELASKLCVLKLNGGLGTTMGCVGPKSAIEVREGSSFLDLNVKQIKYLNKEYGCEVPLILMNSFNTHEDTMAILRKYASSRVWIETFNQSRYPRVLKDTLTPMPSNPEGSLTEWYPPGHGDVFQAMYDSGLLQRLLAQGKEYLFISNIDNLAATVNFDILEHMEESDCEYLMEVTDKTRADIKGGTLIEYGGMIKLLEIAQVPSQHVEDFKSIKKFKIFNTNNIWVSLSAIKRIVESGVLKDMDVICNPKSVSGKPVIQLETAVGAAIQFFKNAHGINVPRDRFLPVKSTADLLAIQSDLYKLEHGTLIMNPARAFGGAPIVKLGPAFKDVAAYYERFASVPNMLELDQLTVSGDVFFGAKVTLKGTVIVVANHGARIDIPSGSVLENKVVTGELHILEH